MTSIQFHIDLSSNVARRIGDEVDDVWDVLDSAGVKADVMIDVDVSIEVFSENMEIPDSEDPQKIADSVVEELKIALNTSSVTATVHRDDDPSPWS